MGLFDGKKIAILGLANEQSIAWGIATALHREGAQLCFSYPNEALEKRVRPLAESLGSDLVLKCDVADDGEIIDCFQKIGAAWGGLDGVVHSIAFADKKDLHNRFHQISRSGFKLALDISAYSLVAITREAKPLMMGRPHASVLTLSYLGAERVIENYNIMGVAKAALESSVRYLAADLGPDGIRVNAISAGPLKTLAAYGIPRFKELLHQFSVKAPMKRNVTLEDVGGAAAFLLSPLACGVSGEIMYVDCGFNVVGV